MPRAIWNGQVIAESDTVERVEGNTYFPPEALNGDCFRESRHTTVCPWKGTARYLDVVVDGEVNPEAAWYYPEPKPAAAAIRDHVAFWKGVVVE